MTRHSRKQLAILAVGLFAAFSGRAQSTGPLAHWSMNGNPNDVSGNGHHGTLHNVTLTTGRNGIANSAYFFNGTGSYISVPYSPVWNVTQYTIGAVIKPTAFNTALCQGNYIVARGGQTPGRWAVSYNDNQSNDCYTVDTSAFLFQNYPGMALSAANYTQYGPPLHTNTWYTVIATYDGTWAKLYVNGVLYSAVIYAAGMSATTDSVLIGRETANPASSYPFPFIGAIDDIRFFNRVLSTNEITDYSIPVPSAPPSDTGTTGGGSNTGGGTGGSGNLAVATVSTEEPFQLSPNPATQAADLLFSGAQTEPAELRLFDALGRLVFQAPVLNGHLHLDLASYPSGVYIARLRSGNSEWVRRLTKQ